MRLFRLVPLLLLLLLATAVPRAALAGYNAGDACDKAGKIYTAENSATPALVCNGTTLQIFESVDINPTRKGVALSAPETTLDVNGEIRPGYTGIACSATTEGAIRYNSATDQVNYCNGTVWTNLAAVQGTPAITAPAGSGYFVLTGTAWNGNLGDLAGANAKCLTELATTYTTWNGYTDASTRGLLNSTHVKAFLCNGSTCNNLMPLTTYYFARANSTTAGGAYFTTDSSGRGPSDSNNWAAANYFSGTFSYWMTRASVSNTLFSTGPYTGAGGNYCANYMTSSGADGAFTGSSSSTGSVRWLTAPSPSPATLCNTTQNLICLVNP